ncbi:unnamed protein product, partial [Brachionus calyciflorus]
MAESIESQLDKMSLEDPMGNVTLSQNGHPQLCFKFYYYKVASSKDGLVNWRCVKNNCNIKCPTSGDKVGESYNVCIDEKLLHNHSSDSLKFSKLEKRRNLTNKVMFSDENPRKIMSQFVNQLSTEEEIAQSTSNDPDRQFINRIKRKNKPEYLNLAEPIKLSDIIIPTNLTLTLDEKENFLLYDSGPDDSDRFFVFGTITKAIRKGSYIFADGTFDIVPNLFLQVHSLHVLINLKT